jgi:hypothetical protein
MNLPTIVVLSKYADIFDGFKLSVERDAYWAPKILIRDGREISEPKGWQMTVTPLKTPFSAAAYSNWGMRKCANDVLLCGDDIRFIEPNTVERLQEIAYRDDKLGILSPKIVGCAQNIQMNPPDTEASFTETQENIGLMCTYIKRSTINKVGYFDERFTGYGFDDFDYCRRTREAGLKIGVTARVSVKHSDTYGTTFRRTFSEKEIQQQAEENQKRFDRKYEPTKV